MTNQIYHPAMTFYPSTAFRWWSAPAWAHTRNLYWSQTGSGNVGRPFPFVISLVRLGSVDRDRKWLCSHCALMLGGGPASHQSWDVSTQMNDIKQEKGQKAIIKEANEALWGFCCFWWATVFCHWKKRWADSRCWSIREKRWADLQLKHPGAAAALMMTQGVGHGNALMVATTGPDHDVIDCHILQKPSSDAIFSTCTQNFGSVTQRWHGCLGRRSHHPHPASGGAQPRPPNKHIATERKKEKRKCINKEIKKECRNKEIC